MRRVAALVALCCGLGVSAPSNASPPTAPGSLAASSASSTQINLSWVASTDSVSISSYVIERCQGSGCSNFAQVGTVASGTAYTDSGLSPGTVYQYAVYATDSAGSGPNSNVASGSTFPASAAGAITYTYDAKGRLLQANVPALGIVENYTYDASGNLLSMTSEPASTLGISGGAVRGGYAGLAGAIAGSLAQRAAQQFLGLYCTYSSAP
jgi:YD repeat-containing protein